MLVLLFAAIVYVFLLLGVFNFVACIGYPRMRKYALSVALWCAVCGPCVCALLMFAGLIGVAEAYAQHHGATILYPLPRLPGIVFGGYSTVGLAGTAVIASLAAWLHQFLIHRMTFALFRVYAAAVCSGMGVVLGLFIGWCLMADAGSRFWPLYVLEMLALWLGMGYAGWRFARLLRGVAPTRFALVSREEFEDGEVTLPVH